MSAVLSLGLGYLLGCFNPASWLGKKKHVDIRNEGTKNLGTTNAAYLMGKKAGIFVLTFDIGKSFLSYRLARILFPHLLLAGFLACIGCILGHCFPVTMGFEGGKGLAAFGGLILAYDPRFFLFIVTCGILLLILLNTGVAAPVFGIVMFPILVSIKSDSAAQTLMAAAASAIIAFTHLPNIKKALKRQDVVNTQEFFGAVFGKKNKTKPDSQNNM